MEPFGSSDSYKTQSLKLSKRINAYCHRLIKNFPHSEESWQKVFISSYLNLKNLDYSSKFFIFSSFNLLSFILYFQIYFLSSHRLRYNMQKPCYVNTIMFCKLLIKLHNRCCLRNLPKQINLIIIIPMVHVTDKWF